jgi:hypothetical protein
MYTKRDDHDELVNVALGILFAAVVAGFWTAVILVAVWLI